MRKESPKHMAGTEERVGLHCMVLLCSVLASYKYINYGCTLWYSRNYSMYTIHACRELVTRNISEQMLNHN